MKLLICLLFVFTAGTSFAFDARHARLEAILEAGAKHKQSEKVQTRFRLRGCQLIETTEFICRSDLLTKKHRHVTYFSSIGSDEPAVGSAMRETRRRLFYEVSEPIAGKLHRQHRLYQEINEDAISRYRSNPRPRIAYLAKRLNAELDRDIVRQKSWRIEKCSGIAYERPSDWEHLTLLVLPKDEKEFLSLFSEVLRECVVPTS